MKKIGMLTSGGDCQALNATMRGVARGLENLFEEVEIYGFLDGLTLTLRTGFSKEFETPVLWH